MNTTYDLSCAEKVVADYITELRNPRRVGRIGRSWLEFCMERNGLIRDVRSLGFGQSHALWYAALVITKRVQEVSRMEVELGVAQRSATTARTIRRCLSEKYTPTRDTLTARLLREILEAQSTLESQRPTAV